MKYFLSILSFTLCLASSAQNHKLVVHEWGTFTSRYNGLGIPFQDLNKVIDEKVPSFVHNINFDNFNVLSRSQAKEDYWYSNRVLSLENVYIKMETPVLYFYSDRPIDNLDVKVQFPFGSISEFYPLPYHREDTTYVRSKVKFREFTIDSRIPSWGDAPYLSFKNYNGFASWKINVLDKAISILPSEPDASVPNVWLAPRKTMSNMIEANGEREKYIFYRGLASFTNPIIPFYSKSGNIIVKNNCDQDLNYVLVYEMTEDGKRFIWENSKSLKAQYETMFIKSRTEISDQLWETSFRLKFIEALVSEGLYHDEAEAMLNTWNNSYFEKPGIKIFWTAPRQFTDEILPISFSVSPISLERVMVGRTEIENFNSSNTVQYREDYPFEQTKTSYTVYPNPTTSELFIRSDYFTSETVEIELVDFSGRKVYQGELTIVPTMSEKIPIENIARGIYRLKINNGRNKCGRQLNISIR